MGNRALRVYAADRLRIDLARRALDGGPRSERMRFWCGQSPESRSRGCRCSPTQVLWWSWPRTRFACFLRS